MVYSSLLSLFSANAFALNLIFLKFLQKRVKDSFLNTLFSSFFISFFSFFYILYNGSLSLFFDMKFMIFIILINFINVLSLVFLFKAFERMDVSLVTAIANSNSIIFVILQALVFLVFPSFLKFIIMILLILNLFLIICGKNIFNWRFLVSNLKSSGVFFSFLVFFCWGLINFLMVFLSQKFGYVNSDVASFTTFLMFLFSFCFVFLNSFCFDKSCFLKSFSLDKKILLVLFSSLKSFFVQFKVLFFDFKVFLWSFLSGFFSFLGFLFFMFSVSGSDSVVSVIILNSQIIFVMIYSSFIFKEKLSLIVKLGIFIEFLLLSLLILL